jgi:hypothetical protein
MLAVEVDVESMRRSGLKLRCEAKRSYRSRAEKLLILEQAQALGSTVRQSVRRTGSAPMAWAAAPIGRLPGAQEITVPQDQRTVRAYLEFYVRYHNEPAEMGGSETART